MKISHRHNNNLLSNWWWTVDRTTLAIVAALMLIGIVMVSTASPAVAEHIGLDGFYFVRRQLLFLVVAVGIIFGLSLLSPVTIRRIALFGYIGGVVLLIAVLAVGAEVKGAKRWINIGFSLQPSEFMKPFFIVLTAWFLSQKDTIRQMNSYQLIIGSYLVLAALLILQPDFGMTVTITTIWGVQLFLGGLPMLWVVIAAFLAPIGVLAAYSFLPHVAQRINSFLDPSTQSYQVSKSMEAFNSGGFFGKGPGEGTVKQHLPDSHTDFIFAVTGEELGLLVSLIIVGLFAALVIRNYMRAFEQTDLFTMYAVAGLATQIGLQACINMAVTLNLIPNKGMTLPFISYGGSSLLATSIAMGMLLALTRKRYGQRMMTRSVI